MNYSKQLESYKAMRRIYDRTNWDRNSKNASFFNEISMQHLDKQIEQLTELALQEKIQKALENTNISVSFDDEKIADAIAKSLTDGSGRRM